MTFWTINIFSSLFWSLFKNFFIAPFLNFWIFSQDKKCPTDRIWYCIRSTQVKTFDWFIIWALLLSTNDPRMFQPDHPGLSSHATKKLTPHISRWSCRTKALGPRVLILRYWHVIRQCTNGERLYMAKNLGISLQIPISGVCQTYRFRGHWSCRITS